MVEGWRSTTHDWRAEVDEAHLRDVGQHPDRYAPGGVVHLLHEVLAYVSDEVEAVPGADRRCAVELLPDGSVSVRDHGRGTDTRVDGDGRVVRKPVMATRDLRFTGGPVTQRLPDGHPRRGMSVVAALSDWLVHENRRREGAWQQRYERGLPADELSALDPDGTTGTTVRFRPAASLAVLTDADLAALPAAWPALRLALERARPTG